MSDPKVGSGWIFCPKPDPATTLIDEDKHRYFKKIVYYINHSNIERIMLFRKNLRQTLRLFLLNGFAYFEPKISQLIKHIYQKCSSLFFVLLFRSKQLLFEQNDFDFRLSVVLKDNQHFRCNVIDRLNFKYCRKILKLSTRFFENARLMSQSFKAAFQFVYRTDYSIFNVMHFETDAIQ